MASGLAGHEHDFYVYVNDSSWLNKPGSGGVEYSNLNEGLPYWFNGMVPMAYILDDERLKGQVHAVANTVLGWQSEDGWIGPEVGEERNFWARTPFFLGLTQLAEANSGQWGDKVVMGLRKFMTLANKMLKNDSEGFTRCGKDVDCNWGQVRIHDMIITIQWLLEKFPSDQDTLLWDNMDMFYSQLQYKWDEWYTEGKYPKVVDPSDGSIFPYIHGVNVGQGMFNSSLLELSLTATGLKASSVVYRFKKTDYFVQKSQNAVSFTFDYHGSASGTILADEEQRDQASYMASELCTAVETTYSLAYMYQVHGDNSFADRAERTAFNAMPVMMTGDKWAHSYMAQPNQPFAVSTIQKDGSVPQLFTTANSGVSTTFGMEPQYPCCTVNHPQGYPKFVSNSWVAIGQNGIGHALLGPSSVQTKINGGNVAITCDTKYPFANVLRYTVTSDTPFELHIRVPTWADVSATTTRVKGKPGNVTPDPKTGMHKIQLPKGRSQITYTIATAVRTEKRPNDGVAVFYGGLLYSLDVGYTETSTLPHAYYDQKSGGIPGLPFEQLRDYYVNSTKEWNVAIDPSTIKYHGDAHKLPDPIFEHNAPPNYMTVDGCTIKWGLKLGVTPDIIPKDRTCTGPKKTYKLIPFGGAKVHMSELPTVTF